MAGRPAALKDSEIFQNTLSWEEELNPFETPKSKHSAPAKAPAKKTQTARQTTRVREVAGWLWLDNMQYREPQPLLEQGTCGPHKDCKYTYHTGQKGLKTFLKYLKWIIETKAIFALDFETGPCKTAPVDPTTGEFDLTRLAYETYHKDSNSDPHTSVVFLASISVLPGQSHVIDVREMRREYEEEFAELLGQACTVGRMIAHNAAFEWGFIKALTGVDANVYMDTMIATRIAYAGMVSDTAAWADPRKPPPFLADEATCLKRELGVEPDKKWQKFFLEMHPDSGFVNEQIAYVAGDTAYLLQLSEALIVKLKKRKLLHIWETIERPFLPLVAKTHYDGVRVDVSLMIQYRNEAQDALADIEPRWNAMKVLIPEENPVTHKVVMRPVNYKSQPDLVTYFQAKYPARSLTNLKGKVSIDDFVLLVLMEEEQDKVAAIIRELRIIDRVLGTYLKPWIETHRNPLTGNIHCSFSQCDTATGRMSAKLPNLQNLPSQSLWHKIRNCFISSPGHLLIDRDLSQFEVRALADMAGEVDMIDFFLRALAVEKKIRSLWKDNPEWGLMTEDSRKDCPDERIQLLLKEKATLDFHSLNAAAVFEKAFTEGTDSVRALLRKQGKGLSFGIPYGISASKISGDFKIGLDAAQALKDKYFKTWKKIEKYLEKQKYDARQRSVSISPTGRLRFYPTKLPSAFTERDCRGVISSFERQGQNFSVQSINGDVLKVASILMKPFLERHHARIVLWVHDEIVVDCPEEHVAVVAHEMERCMIEAAPLCGLKTCPIETSVESGPCWSH